MPISAGSVANFDKRQSLWNTILILFRNILNNFIIKDLLGWGIFNSLQNCLHLKYELLTPTLSIKHLNVKK